MIIAVDFDGTIVEHQYPAIGPEKPFAIETLKKLVEEQHRVDCQGRQTTGGCRTFLSGTGIGILCGQPELSGRKRLYGKKNQGRSLDR